MTTMTRRIPEIEGMRSIAAILVVAYHVRILRTTYCSFEELEVPPPSILYQVATFWATSLDTALVDIFFLISGFVMTKTFAEHRDDPWRQWRLQTAKRALRMWSLVVPIAALMGFATSSFAGFADTLLFANNDRRPRPFVEQPWPATWSVAVTMQMAVFMPFVIAIVERACASRRRRTVAFLLLAALATVVKCVMVYRAFPQHMHNLGFEHGSVTLDASLLEAYREAYGAKHLPWEGSPKVEFAKGGFIVWVRTQFPTSMRVPTFFIGAALAYATTEESASRTAGTLTRVAPLIVYLTCALLSYALNLTDDLRLKTSLMYAFTSPWVATWLYLSMRGIGRFGRWSQAVLRWAPLQRLACVTFSIYMTHLFVLVPMSLALPRAFASHDPFVFGPLVVGAVVLSVVLGSVVHMCVEKPLTNFMYRHVHTIVADKCKNF